MDLTGMTLKELWGRLEYYLGAAGMRERSVLWLACAELKRRCEEPVEMRPISLAPGNCPRPPHQTLCGGPIGTVCVTCRVWAEPACPCPVVGKGPELHIVVCPKCGEVQPQHLKRTYGPVQIDWYEPCLACYRSRPDAPSGYAFVGEWRQPENAHEPWLDYHGRLRRGAGPTGPCGIDGGKRWILRKVEEPCPKCGKPAPNAAPGQPCVECFLSRPSAPPGYEYVEQSIDAGRRWILRKLPEVKCPTCRAVLGWNPDIRSDRPCPLCVARRSPAPSGYEHADEWRPPKTGEFYLCQGTVRQAAYDHNAARWILRKVVREATPIQALTAQVQGVVRRVEKLEEQHG